MTSRKQSIIVGTLLAIVGAVLCFVALGPMLPGSQGRTARAEGVVVDVGMDRGSGRMGDTYTAYVRFKDAAGKTWTVPGPDESTPSTVGAGVTVAYDPNNPENAYPVVDTFDLKWLGILAGGLFFLIGGGAIVLTEVKPKRPYRPPPKTAAAPTFYASAPNVSPPSAPSSAAPYHTPVEQTPPPTPTSVTPPLPTDLYTPANTLPTHDSGLWLALSILSVCVGVIGLVPVVVTIVLGIAALVLGLLAMSPPRSDNKVVKMLGIVGVCLGGLSIAINLAVVVVGFTSSSNRPQIDAKALTSSIQLAVGLPVVEDKNVDTFVHSTPHSWRKTGWSEPNEAVVLVYVSPDDVPTSTALSEVANFSGTQNISEGAIHGVEPPPPSPVDPFANLLGSRTTWLESSSNIAYVARASKVGTSATAVAVCAVRANAVNKKLLDACPAKVLSAVNAQLSTAAK